MSIRILGSQESNASNGTWFGVETKKLWPFEDECAKLSGNFAANEPFRRVFRSCKTTFWHTSATSQSHMAISQLRNGLQKSSPLQNPPPTVETISKLQKWDAIYFFMFLFSFWLPNGCKMISKLQNDFQALKWAAEIFFFFSLGCKMISKIQNDFQAIKMTCKMKRGLRKHLAKPREIAKMPTKPRNHASKEESPLIEITHTKPLTPFLIS